MSELKELSKEAIPAALEKAMRYRLLNEPAEAESICLDVLAAEPENQQALIMLLLAVTDRFSKSYGVSDTQAKQILTRIRGEYEHAYYSGILAERRAKAQLARERPVVVIRRTRDSVKRWIGSKRRKRFAPPEMTMPCCAGTPARA